MSLPADGSVPATASCCDCMKASPLAVPLRPFQILCPRHCGVREATAGAHRCLAACLQQSGMSPIRVVPDNSQQVSQEQSLPCGCPSAPSQRPPGCREGGVSTFHPSCIWLRVTKVRACVHALGDRQPPSWDAVADSKEIKDQDKAMQLCAGLGAEPMMLGATPGSELSSGDWCLRGKPGVRHKGNGFGEEVGPGQVSLKEQAFAVGSPIGDPRSSP